MVLIKVIKALAEERRLKILQLLTASDLWVGSLAKHLSISKPAVSQHLQILRKAGLVKGEKRSYWTHHIVEREALNQVASQISEPAAKMSETKGIKLQHNRFAQSNFIARQICHSYRTKTDPTGSCVYLPIPACRN